MTIGAKLLIHLTNFPKFSTLCMLRSAQIFFVRNAYRVVEVDADLLLSGCFNVEWGLLEIASLFAHFISRALTNTLAQKSANGSSQPKMGCGS